MNAAPGPDMDRVAAAPPERLFTSVLMAFVALVSNAVRPSHDDIRGHIELAREPYFRSFLDHCMSRVYRKS
ncbi:MAG TPA: hypothetical protein VF960_06455 [Chloroflexota bacterium]